MSRTLWLFLMLVAASALLNREVGAHSDADEEDDYINDDDDYDGDGNDEEETYTGPPPVIHSRARELSVKPGETARLPCEVEHGDQVVVMWKKGNQMLYTDKIRSTGVDRRISKEMDNTLVIASLKPTDAGQYMCILGTPEKPTVTHTLHILMTPRIEKILPGPIKMLKKGSPVTLECSATGYPKPSITWSRKGKNMPDGEEMMEGSAITFESVSRKHAGVYECMASNNIGEPATASVDIHVQYSPEIEIEKEIVNSGEGYDAELVCEVHAEPKANVLWLKDDKVIPKRHERLTMTKSGSRNMLQIKSTQKDDFGSYTCHANNTLGRMDRVIRLSGEPSPAKFVTAEPEETGQTLEWKIESHSPITKYELRYRNKKTSDWKTLHPMVENPEGNVYNVQHKITDLSAGTYEVILLAQNTYGWSDPSIPHIFELNSKEDTSAAGAQSPLLALLTIVSLSTFFL